MTAEDLDRLESLWKQGVKRSDIAAELGYCEATLYYWMKKDPVRFPPRRQYVDNESKMELWCYRIIAGRATIKEVARIFGVSEITVRKRVGKIKHGRIRSCRSQAG